MTDKNYLLQHGQALPVRVVNVCVSECRAMARQGVGGSRVNGWSLWYEYDCISNVTLCSLPLKRERLCVYLETKALC
jgi:hypothetical protein